MGLEPGFEKRAVGRKESTFPAFGHFFGHGLFVVIHLGVFGQFPLEGGDEEEAFRDFAGSGDFSGIQLGCGLGDDALIGDVGGGLVLGVGRGFGGGEASRGGRFDEGFAGFDSFGDAGARGVRGCFQGLGQGVGGQFFTDFGFDLIQGKQGRGFHFGEFENAVTFGGLQGVGQGRVVGGLEDFGDQFGLRFKVFGRGRGGKGVAEERFQPGGFHDFIKGAGAAFFGGEI